MPSDTLSNERLAISSRPACCTCWATTTKRTLTAVACVNWRRRLFDRLALPVSDTPRTHQQELSVAPLSRVRRIARSFGYAFEGVAIIVPTQPNFWIHVLAAILAMALGIALRLSPVELAV